MLTTGKPGRRYVTKAVAGKGWRIWDKTQRTWWGEFYPKRPEELLDELNGPKRPFAITELTRKCQKSRVKPKEPKRIK